MYNKPFQANMTKEMVHFFPQVLYLLEINLWDFVLEKTFFDLLGFSVKVHNRYLEILKRICKVSEVRVVGGIGFSAWPSAVFFVKVGV